MTEGYLISSLTKEDKYGHTSMITSTSYHYHNPNFHVDEVNQLGETALHVAVEKGRRPPVITPHALSFFLLPARLDGHSPVVGTSLPSSPALHACTLPR